MQETWKIHQKQKNEIIGIAQEIAVKIIDQSVLTSMRQKIPWRSVPKLELIFLT